MKKVGLIFGGRSSEHEISIVSATSVFKHFPDKYQAVPIFITKEGKWKFVRSPWELEGEEYPFLPWEGKDIKEKIDIYFPLLHGPYGEDGTIQGLLELADIPYVGSGVIGSAIGMDKSYMKMAFEKEHLPVLPYKVIRKWENFDQEEIRNRFKLPVFVKPSSLGSSVGITKVKEWNALEEAVKEAFFYDYKILIEMGIEGREIECSVLGNENPVASSPGEIIPYREFYDYRDKYVDGKTEFKIPVSLPERIEGKIREYAIRAFKSIEAWGFARVDFFLLDDNIYVNEINTIPGFTEISMFPKLWEVSGITFEKLIEKLIELGFERQRKWKMAG